MFPPPEAGEACQKIFSADTTLETAVCLSRRNLLYWYTTMIVKEAIV